MVRRSTALRVLAPSIVSIAIGCRDGAPTMGETDPGAEGSDTTAEDDGSSGDEPTACMAGQTRPCYEGPPGTEGLGICAAGEQTCAADGSGWSACAGEVHPAVAESCSTPEDDDCDGTAICEPVLGWWQSSPGAILQLALDDERHTIMAGAPSVLEFQGLPIEGPFLLELDDAGELRWGRSFGAGVSMGFEGLVVDEQGGFTIAGYYDGVLDLGGGPLPGEPSFGSQSSYVARYDSEGEHLWSHSEEVYSFSSLAVGPDGTAYVVGLDYAELDGITHEVLIIAAFDPGAPAGPAWVQQGWGVYGLYDEGLSIAVTDDGELVVAAVMGDENFLEPELGGTPLDLPDYGLVLLHLDGTGALVDQRPAQQEMVQNVSDVELLSRGGSEVELVVNLYGGSLGQSVMLTRYDAALELRNEVRLGEDAWALAVDPLPDGTTALGIEFSGQLELGPIGAGLPTFNPGIAITAVDEAGNGRWLELMYSDSYVSLSSLAAGPGGEVLVAAAVDGTLTLGGEPVYGNFLAMLRL